MRNGTWAFFTLGLMAAMPAIACDNNVINEQITAISSAIQSNTATNADEPIKKLKDELEKCGDFQNVTITKSDEILTSISNGKNQLLDAEKNIIGKSAPYYDKTGDDVRLQLIGKILDASSAIDASVANAEVVKQLCTNHKDGKLQELTRNLYTSADKAAQPPLTKYINSCINASQSMERNKFTQVTSELKNSLKWVEQTQGMIFLTGNDIDKIPNLDYASVELKRGVNAFSPTRNGWSDPYVSYFYVGYEGTTVDDVENKGAARVGLYIYNQFNSLNGICPPKPGKCNNKFIASDTFPHLYGNFFQSSSAESSKSTTTGGGGTQADVVTSMEASIGTFWPAIAHQQEAHEDRESVVAVGPIVEHGWKKDAGVQELVQRKYAGLRLAFSPDSYFDVMRGHTEGRIGERVELRGQYPLTDFSVGRLMLGGAINYDHGKEEANTDSMRIYLIYHASFNDVFGTTKSGE